MLTQPPNIGFVACQSRAMDTTLLSGADADCLSVFDITHRVALRVFQNDECDDQIPFGFGRKRFVPCGYIVKQRGIIEPYVIAMLFESDTKHLLAFNRIRLIVRINLDDIIGSFTFVLQYFESFWSEIRCYHAVGHLAFDECCRDGITRIAQRNEVSVTAHTICSACTCISTSQWREFHRNVINEIYPFQSVVQRQPNSCSGRRNMFERGSSSHSRGRFQLFDELPTVECIKKIDVARSAVEHFDRQFAFVDENARRLLIRITSVFKR